MLTLHLFSVTLCEHWHVNIKFSEQNVQQQFVFFCIMQDATPARQWGQRASRYKLHLWCRTGQYRGNKNTKQKQTPRLATGKESIVSLAGLSVFTKTAYTCYFWCKRCMLFSEGVQFLKVNRTERKKDAFRCSGLDFVGVRGEAALLL